MLAYLSFCICHLIQLLYSRDSIFQEGGIDEPVVFAFYRVHRAGPRKEIYYEPEEVKAAIVTCGGLCPGLNDVIRQVLSFQYRARNWLFLYMPEV